MPQMQKGAIVPRGAHSPDPRCVLHGCSSEDVKGIQAFLRQKQIDDAVQDYLNRGDDPMPPQTLAAPTTGGSPESTRLCLKCLKGGKGVRPRSTASADEKIPDHRRETEDPLQQVFGITSPPTRASSPMRTPARAMASPPAALIPPPLTFTKGDLLRAFFEFPTNLETDSAEHKSNERGSLSP